VEEDWPLQILDHTGRPHSVILHPGEMVWYESARLVHARMSPLKGKAFENIFVHFMPRSLAWYSDDFR
jgi:prolyl 4-hydroxylase